jgi:hypothetical protein
MNQVGSSTLEVGTIIIAIDNHMAIIQIQIGKNTIKNVLLDRGSGIYIITIVEIEVGVSKA